ncbi:polyprenol phosphomannose-dependent alpha 1,6 mannosyltransferase MptB [Lentzea sp. NPDC051213]|uniref:polyprenol phosphomannose-dependent alpha 1,6 mannosyltransferase MptB n=1 Tax=Lentzea sp. NPDC051213 TaxID=3364126 RepID=UPI003791276B
MAATPSLPRTSSEVSPQELSVVPTNTYAIPIRTTMLGLLGVALIALGGMGAGAILERDPLLTQVGLSWLRYGHGRDLASMVLYLGLGLVIWAWIRLGRLVRWGEIGDFAVLVAVTVWTLPLLFAPPLFSKDIYSYLAQGQLALSGYDPYTVGPAVLQSTLSENVSWVWQHTPAPYGPLFILIAKAIVWVTDASVILGVVAMRLSIAGGLVLLCWALPGLSRHLGGKSAIALWLVAANPLLLIHLIGGAHNDLLMIGLMAAGVLLVLDRRHVLGFVLLGLAFSVKATAIVIVPFLVWIWAARLEGDKRTQFRKALLPAVAAFVGTFLACTLVAGVSLGWILALRSSSMIINWLSLPSAVGDFVRMVVNWFVYVDGGIFIGVARALGSAVLIWIAYTQWWAARDGEVRDAIRRGAVTMLAVALLSPATLPWYFSWPLALAAGFAWTTGPLVTVTLASLFLLLVTFPNGDTALYSWGYLFFALVVSGLAARSLVKPDPFGLSTRYE